MTHLKKQILIDILLLITIPVVLITGYILDFRLIERPGRGIIKTVHIYSGYIVTVLIILHLVQYFKVLLNKLRVRNK